MNDTNRIGILLFLYSRGELTDDEKGELMVWRSLSPENEQLFNEIANPEFVRRLMRDFYKEREEVFDNLKMRFPLLADGNWYDTNETLADAVLNDPDEEFQMSSAERDIPDSGDSKAEFWNMMLENAKISDAGTFSDSDAENHLYMSMDRNKKRPGRLKKILKRTAVTIAAIFLVAITLNSILSDDDEPERFQASMGLPGLKEFKLSDFNRGFLDGWADVTFRKTAKGERVRVFSEVKKAPKDAIYYIVTYKGNETILQLPDGTMLWMYPNSSIHFPAHFTGDTIHLGVKGKIYFESSSLKHLVISKDTSVQEYGDDKGLQPSANEIRVELSKAAFDITARSRDSTVSINLLSGSAFVSLKDHPESQPILLGAGKQITVGQSMHEPGVSADSSNILSLKNGEIYFKDASLKDVMFTISQWYNIKIQYDVDADPDQKVSLRVPLGSKLADILLYLKVHGVPVAQEGGTIWVRKE